MKNKALKVFGLMAWALCIAIGFAVPAAKADSVTYNFDYSIVDGAKGSALSPAWGTITFSDDVANPNYVDVSLTVNSPYKILAFGGNFNAFLPDTYSGSTKTTTWLFAFDNSTPPGVDIAASPDAYVADGSGNYGKFDFNIDGPALTSASTQTFTGVLKYEEWNVLTTNPGKGDPTTLTGNVANLNAANFAVKDSQNIFYAWVHLGNVPTTGSLAVGASTPQFVPPPPVPEPASMLLLGLGLIGVATLRKRFKK